MTPEEFRRQGHELIDWLADYRARVYRGEVPATAQVGPGWLRGRLPETPPAQAEAFEAIRRDLDQQILPALGHITHPAYFAYFPANSLLASVLGDLASTGLAQIGLNWASSPALTELEEVVMSWLRQMLGLSNAWSGVIQDTA